MSERRPSPSRGHGFRWTEPEVLSSGRGTHDLALGAAGPIASGTLAWGHSVGGALT
jgi:hypothetical protein